MKDHHFPVLLNESIALLNINSDGVYVDGTFGRGGHTKAILQHLGSNGRVIAFDKDIQAYRYALSEISDVRFMVVRDSFSNIDKHLSMLNIKKVDGILLDLGVSSPQLQDADRGFSFSREGLLDMRMDNTNGITAREWINEVDEKTLADVLYKYGQERFSRIIAKNIVHKRIKEPICSTTQLSMIIEKSVPVRDKNKHVATRSFQAIRIFINNELAELEQALIKMPDLLQIGGRIVVISFHSLEDTIVKDAFNNLSMGELLPKWVSTPYLELSKFQIIAKKIKASGSEILQNKRSRSAILRAIERKQ